jgi:hypothetical protein
MFHGELLQFLCLSVSLPKRFGLIHNNSIPDSGLL